MNFFLLVLFSQFIIAQSKIDLKAIKSDVLEISKQRNIPSLDLIIQSNEDSIQANYNHPELAAQTVYNIGSTTKLLSSTLLFSLIENGELNISDRVDSYIDHPYLNDIPGFSEVKIGDLLQHTSGISDYTKNPDWIQHVITNTAPKSFDDKLLLIEKSLQNQGNFNYSNSNYLLLEQIIETVTDQKFSEVFNNFYSDLGLSEISLNRPEKAVQSFFAVDDKSSSNVSAWEEHYGLDGGAYATVRAMNRFIKLLLIEKLILNETNLLMMQKWIPMKPLEIPIGEGKIYQYGYGIMKMVYEGDSYIGHSGGTLKYQSFLFYNEEAQASVILLTNCSGRFYNNVFFQELVPTILKNI